jgi:hypothetical protein
MKKEVNITVTVRDDNYIVVETTNPMTPEPNDSITINAEECRCLISLLYSAEFELGARKREGKD